MGEMVVVEILIVALCDEAMRVAAMVAAWLENGVWEEDEATSSWRLCVSWHVARLKKKITWEWF